MLGKEDMTSQQPCTELGWVVGGGAHTHTRSMVTVDIVWRVCTWFGQGVQCGVELLSPGARTEPGAQWHERPGHGELQLKFSYLHGNL